MALPIRNNSRRVKPFDICPPSRGFAPRTPLHGRSRGPPRPAPLPWLTHFVRSLLSAGLRPSNSPTRSLAGTPTPRSAPVAHSLRSFASVCGASPLELPYTVARGDPHAPLRSRGSLTSFVRFCLRGFAPRTPLHGRSRGPPRPAPLPWLTHFVRSLLSAGLRPSNSPTRSLAGTPTPRSAPVAHSLRSFASVCGASPLELPYTVARGDPHAPLRSRGSLTSFVRFCLQASP